MALYVGDTYRATRELTLSSGCAGRISAHPMKPTDSSGPTVPLTQYFAKRNSLQSQGVPQNAMPNARLQMGSERSRQRKATWWKPSNQNFAPLGMAYAPRTGAA